MSAKRNLLIPLSLLLLLFTAALAMPVLGAARPADQLAGVSERLDELVQDLKGRSSLSRSQISELRGELSSLRREVEAVREQLDKGNQPGPGKPPAGWVRYEQAEADIWPSWAKFEGWNSKRKFKAETEDDDGTLFFSLDNVDYSVEWEIRQAYSGSPRVTVDPMADGDVYLTVRDSRGSREFLLKNGGIGPLYVRDGSGGGGKSISPPVKGQGNMAWTRPYEDLVKAGQLSRSPGMEWFIDQVEQDAYATQSLAALGRYLRGELPEQVRGEIAVLKYTQLFKTKRISIPDPRNSVSSFVYAIEKAHGLYQDGQAFTIEMQ